MKRNFCLLVLAVSLVACAGSLRGEHATVAAKTWVDETLAGLSLEQKVGQMIYPRSDGVFVNASDPESRTLTEAARSGRIGGGVFFKGEPYETAAIVNRLQEASKLPLLMASDYEWGTAMRVQGGRRFPRAMAMGAGASLVDMEFQAEVTAREALAYGIHLLLNPVLDLSTNPKNRVITTRSFGQDPERAGALGVAFIERAQSLGVLTTAKHFPGHGATVVDSHLGLPVLDFDLERLKRVEMAPFRAAIDAGVAAIMPGHIAVPALGGARDRPSTLSSEVLQGVLRGDLGFDGLIVSDALDMGGARQNAWDGEVAVAAVRAGVDMLLVPPDALVAYQAVLRGVERGDIPLARIDSAVRRILEAKARVGLHRTRTVDLKALALRIAEPGFADRLDRVFDKTITLVKNERDLLPFAGAAPPRLLLVDFVFSNDRDSEPDIFAEELERRAAALCRIRLTPRTAATRAKEIRPEDGEVVLVASYARTRSFLGQGELASELGERLSTLARNGTTVVLASLGNPYTLNTVPDAAVLVTTYDGAPGSQRALARALFGEVKISGKLPVGLSERYPQGYGIQVDAHRMKLAEVTHPQDVGMSKSGLEEAARLVEEAIEDGAAPGAVVLVARRGQIVLEKAFGHMSYDDGAERMRLDTLFDLASLTKIFATTTLSMIFYERGVLDLESPVSSYIPEFRGEDKDRVLVKDLLAHSGGLLWWTDLYMKFEGQPPDRARRGYIQTICEMPLDYSPRSKTSYSDLGILLLGEILERVSGKPLDVMAQEEVFDPLAMDDTMFRPPESLLARIAPTEQDAWRGRVVHGEVHDENAFGLGGLAPHAGLFSTASSLAPFPQMYLNGGAYNGRRIVNAETIELFTMRAALAPDSSRALGWDTPSEPSSSGAYFSVESYGHTGFTGTSMWIDPERELFALLLTNRVHPTRENRKLYDVRPKFHDAIMKAIVDMEIHPRGAN